jgi:hypothetical protein
MKRSALTLALVLGTALTMTPLGFDGGFDAAAKGRHKRGGGTAHASAVVTGKNGSTKVSVNCGGGTRSASSSTSSSVSCKR